MSTELTGVRAVHLERKGRGLALRHVWGSSEADIVAYMDADLSTGLDAFLPLIAPLLSGHSDLSIGSRLAHGAQVVRSPRREIISRAITCCCVLFFPPGSPTRSAGSRPDAPKSSGPCFRLSKTMPGFLTLSS